MAWRVWSSECHLSKKANDPLVGRIVFVFLQFRNTGHGTLEYLRGV